MISVVRSKLKNGTSIFSAFSNVVPEMREEGPTAIDALMRLELRIKLAIGQLQPENFEVSNLLEAARKNDMVRKQNCINEFEKYGAVSPHIEGNLESDEPAEMPSVAIEPCHPW